MPKTKKAAKELFLAQNIWLYYEAPVHKEAPELIHAYKYRETLQSELSGLIGATFNDGEPHVQKLLATVAEDNVWKQLVGEDDKGNPRVPCALNYTEHDLDKQSEEYSKWERGIERKARVISEIGAYTGWDGAVSPADYDKVIRRLELAKERFLDQESRTLEERMLWEKVWSFKDNSSE